MPPTAFHTAPPVFVLPDNIFALEGLDRYRAIAKFADEHEENTGQWLLARDEAVGILTRAVDAFAPIPAFPFPKDLSATTHDIYLTEENERWCLRLEQWALDREWFFQRRPQRSPSNSTSPPPLPTPDIDNRPSSVHSAVRAPLRDYASPATPKAVPSHAVISSPAPPSSTFMDTVRIRRRLSSSSGALPEKKKKKRLHAVAQVRLRVPVGQGLRAEYKRRHLKSQRSRIVLYTSGISRHV
jgi:hypothetical protein